MAIYHLSMHTISRSAGRSATAAAAYRAGIAIADTRTGLVHDYSRRRGVLHAQVILPGGTTTDRAAFWDRVEQHHRRGDAVTAREIEVSLPSDLSREQRQALAVGYARELAERYGVAVDVALHAPSRRGDDRNWHAHIMLSACHVSADGTLGKKVVELDPIHCKRAGITSAADEQRETWEMRANAALARAGRVARVDRRSHEARGIEDPPGQHIGAAATGYERRTGRQSDVRRRQREQQRQREHEQREARMEKIDRADSHIEHLSRRLAGALREQERERQASAPSAEQLFADALQRALGRHGQRAGSGETVSLAQLREQQREQHEQRDEDDAQPRS